MLEEGLWQKKRRYSERRGCNYFESYNEQFTPQARKVIKDLQEENASLKVDIEALKCTVCNRMKHAEFSELELECANMRREIKDVKELGGKYKWKMMFCIVILAISSK